MLNRRCMMLTMASPAHEPESKQLLEAQLQGTLNVIPAYTWYAAPSGALTFVNELRTTWVSRKIILSGSASPLALRGIPTFRFSIPTTVRRHVGSGPPA